MRNVKYIFAIINIQVNPWCEKRKLKSHQNHVVFTLLIARLSCTFVKKSVTLHFKLKNTMLCTII